jgi:hypothetical protein
MSFCLANFATLKKYAYEITTWEDNIKLDLWETGVDGANWIPPLTQDRVLWQAFVNTVMNLRVP